VACASFRGTGGTPMTLFARPQRHASHRAQRIIGVSPVFRIPANGDNRKPEKRIAAPQSRSDFQPSFRGAGGDSYATFRSASASRPSPSPKVARLPASSAPLTPVFPERTSVRRRSDGRYSERLTAREYRIHTSPGGQHHQPSGAQPTLALL
jgi:hypothetical protein